jgi:DNA-binding MarR family transcriptional regulator
MDDAPAPWPTPMWHTTGFRLIKLGELVHATAEAVFAPLDLTARQFHVLAASASMDSPSQKDVSHVLGIDPNVMVGVLDELERRGVVRRVRHPDDRRRYIVEPTEAGTRALHKGRELVEQAEEDMFASLSDQDRAALHELAGRLLTAHPRVTKRE